MSLFYLGELYLFVFICAILPVIKHYQPSSLQASGFGFVTLEGVWSFSSTGVGSCYFTRALLLHHNHVIFFLLQMISSKPLGHIAILLHFCTENFSPIFCLFVSLFQIAPSTFFFFFINNQKDTHSLYPRLLTSSILLWQKWREKLRKSSDFVGKVGLVWCCIYFFYISSACLIAPK